MHNYKNIFILAVLTLSFAACSSRQWTVVQAYSPVLRPDDTEMISPDPHYESYIVPFADKNDYDPDEVIGYTSLVQIGGTEEEYADFVTDVYLEAAVAYLGQPVEVAILNPQSLGYPMIVDEIKVSDIFRLIPFDDELIILWLPGKILTGLFEDLASTDMRSLHGIKIVESEGDSILNPIHYKSLNPLKIYKVATGKNYMEDTPDVRQLRESEEKRETGLGIREIIIRYIRERNKL